MKKYFKDASRVWAATWLLWLVIGICSVLVVGIAFVVTDFDATEAEKAAWTSVSLNKTLLYLFLVILSYHVCLVGRITQRALWPVVLIVTVAADSLVTALHGLVYQPPPRSLLNSIAVQFVVSLGQTWLICLIAYAIVPIKDWHQRRRSQLVS